MKDELVSFETAKLAKEKGFKFEFKDDYNYDLGFHSYFKRRSNGEIVDISHWYADTNQNIQQYTSLDIDAPTQSLLQRWLRDVHKIDIVIRAYWKDEKRELIQYVPHVSTFIDVEEEGEDMPEDYKNTYEEALENGLKEALECIN